MSGTVRPCVLPHLLTALPSPLPRAPARHVPGKFPLFACRVRATPPPPRRANGGRRAACERYVPPLPLAFAPDDSHRRGAEFLYPFGPAPVYPNNARVTRSAPSPPWASYFCHLGVTRRGAETVPHATPSPFAWWLPP